MLNFESAKLFITGGSQAVRLPKKFSFKDTSSVYIHKCGNKVILEPVNLSWKPLLESLAALPDDLEILRDAPDYTDKANLF
ncbi:MAG: AbrB/MazE/SpoVT family DNA-binding domain-containing protein [Proteobacteria bacterium]|jgi:antitoxin VapB|nr:AbrB/MazE/SpoVT family DNA-binding domain-containing protein [Pseudomonadota bacterium]